ncbi:MAG: fructose-6-phosphate aldolase [Candidatus Woesearchaeota archaeon]|jgi:transaldolase|nr:fructose-6-phosphate aldolase [archaeon]MDP6548241.1 fructose-6-phosphate aldolase [Candidatus Woesearchaeota archaeon]MDP7263229.1 fructose-6-phosphate aldolase [Candidatus Woesearchaeota archaeon]MDP7623002.1 fructose-6-phosphate aldolase [Candidatus Woesearchaeota archaeon]HJN56644.1 fructose-6-phosphate aldolase [Candidatus Woesearchaeota archaeon]|tara:strand:- start:971 stop:1630 length:660 start_codon:yes stop_codon:yes gene_type:complete
MKIFLDTASVSEIKTANDIIPLDGVTTNPTLIMKEGKDYVKTLKEITKIVNGPISAEPVSLDAEGMVKEGKEFAKLHKNIVIKVPMTPEGMKACKVLSKDGIKVNTTLVFSANQALLAAKAGTYFVSPFLGRLDDIGEKGMDLVKEIKEIYDNYGFKTKILAASIRSTTHVKEAALIGADIATIPFKVYESMFNHALTDKGIKQFLDDWDTLQKELKNK